VAILFVRGLKYNILLIKVKHKFWIKIQTLISSPNAFSIKISPKNSSTKAVLH